VLYIVFVKMIMVLSAIYIVVVKMIMVLSAIYRSCENDNGS